MLVFSPNLNGPVYVVVGLGCSFIIRFMRYAHPTHRVSRWLT
jgi:hypothetical protein